MELNVDGEIPEVQARVLDIVLDEFPSLADNFSKKKTQVRQ